MKRLGSSSDSLLSVFSISSSSPKDEMGFDMEIQAMLDGLDGGDDALELTQASMGKKRRLSLSQVKALEKHFGQDNKLELERKAKLAVELGLQPRQVAVWFQNRRARWKNKKLEKEYEVLKSRYVELKMSYENVGREKEALNIELRDLKMKLSDIPLSESERNSTSGESESNNLNNIVIHEPMNNDYSHHHNQTWSSSSSSFPQFDSSASYLPQSSSWFQNGEQQTIGSVDGFCSVYGAAGEEVPPAGLIWFNIEQLDY